MQPLFLESESPALREHAKNPMQIAFSQAMGIELDALQYVAPPKRSAALAAELGLGRTQAYRLLKGIASPTVECLALLRAKGASIDRMLDALNGHPCATPVSLQLNGGLVSVILQQSLPGASFAYAAVLNGDGSYKLQPIPAGQTAPADAIPIHSFQMVSQDSLAIVEDDPLSLDLLTRQMTPAYRVAPFSNAQALLNYSSDLQAFSAFLIDWRLPDIAGDELIRLIRQRTNAPVFILTGDSSASASIAKVLEQPNTHHVAKPANEIILTKQISNAVLRFRSQASTAYG